MLRLCRRSAVGGRRSAVGGRRSAAIGRKLHPKLSQLISIPFDFALNRDPGRHDLAHEGLGVGEGLGMRNAE
jgi:hypothetical protein